MQLMCCPFANLKRFSDSGDFQETLELNVGFESLRYIIDLDLFDFSSKGYYFTELYLLYFTGHQSKRGDCLYSFLPFTPSPEHWDFCSFRILDGYLLFSIAAHVIIRHLLDRSWMFNSDGCFKDVSSILVQIYSPLEIRIWLNINFVSPVDFMSHLIWVISHDKHWIWKNELSKWASQPLWYKEAPQIWIIPTPYTSFNWNKFFFQWAILIFH